MTDDSAHIHANNAAWSFSGIENEFDQHVERSIPLYHEGHEIVCSVSDFFLPPDSTVIELGCSTGTLANKLLIRHQTREDISYLGIDSVAGMVDRARSLYGDDKRATFEHADLLVHPFDRTSLIISYYTLQFIHPRHRQDVFNKIYNSLEWGGAFVLFEKVRAPDARFQDMAAQIYQEFKLGNGFSESEVINKSQSLKGILEPFSTQGNLDLISRAGFTDVMSISKWVCFEGFLAIK